VGGGVRAVLLCGAILTFASPAQAASLRPLTTLSAPVVLLSDLFDDAGAKAARVLGPAPAPGERIVVEAAQLAAIARQFGVDWRPASGADRAVLDRPGRLLPRETVLAALQAALARVGAPAHIELDLPDFAPPLVALEAQPTVTVEQMDYEGGTGRFTASVLVSGAAMAPLRLRLLGAAAEIVDVLVPAHRLAAGAVLRAGDLVRASLRATAVRGDVVRAAGEAVGMALRHAAPAGQPVQLADLQPPLLVAKGARVAMQLQSFGLTVIAQGVALEAGALGERIQVINPASRMIVEGEVVGAGRVAVAPDSVPFAADAQVAVR
jgi:flagella basal body P-ring formation protein FlgA